MYIMEMGHKRSSSVCKSLLFSKNKRIHQFYGTMILANQHNINLGLMKMMAKMSYFNQYTYMEKGFIQILVLKKRTNKSIHQVAFLITLYFQVQQHLKNGEKP